MSKVEVDNKEPEVMPVVPHSREGKTPANAYDEETVERCLELMLDHTISQVSELTGVSRRTLTEWRGRHGQWLEAIRTTYLIEQIDQNIDRVLANVSDQKLEKASARDLFVNTGILIDKRLQLAGKPASSQNQIRARVAWRTPDGNQTLVEIGDTSTD